MEITFWVTFAAAAVCVVLAIYNVFLRWLLYVPPNYVAVVVNSNNQVSVKRQGYHLVKWPLEHVARVNWAFRGVNSNNQVALIYHNSNFVPTQHISMDTPPFHVKDRAGINVTVDVVLRIVITDPIVAVTQNQNLYGFVAECVESATAHAINLTDYRDTIGQNARIAKLIRDEVEFQIKDTGCKIGTLLVQNISFNKQLSETAERQSIDAQQALIEQNKLTQQRQLDEQRLEHEARLAIAAHDNKVKEMERQQWIRISEAQHAQNIAMQQKEQELQIARQAFEIAKIADEQRRLAQDTEVRLGKLEEERRLAYIGALIKEGFTPEHIVQLLNGVEMAKHVAAGLANNSKMIMSPEHYRQMLVLPWMSAPQPSTSTHD